MIQAIAHVTVYVLNQDEALEFYRDKLNFEVVMDMTMEGGFRWLTVSAKAQPELELVLAEPKEGPMLDKKSAETIRALVENGVFSVGVFATDNCQETYQELLDKGVEFTQPPTKQFYGIEAMGKDNSGNWFSLVQQTAS
jgi:catechol 2,3-dioxygenase-like lactoylglutathione lyase family enzyme